MQIRRKICIIFCNAFVFRVTDCCVENIIFIFCRSTIMESIAAPLRDLIRKSKWTNVRNNSIGEGESESRISKTESEQNSQIISTDASYNVKFAAERDGGYAIVVINLSYTRIWITSMNSDETQWVIRKNLSHLDIDPVTITQLINSVVEGGGVDTNGQMSFKHSTPDTISIITRCNLTLPACDSCLPVIWKMSLKEATATDFSTLIAELVINPTLAVCSGLAYSHSLFQATILQKDRELKHYRENFGSLTIAGKRPSPAFAPESYYGVLLKSDELKSRLTEGSVSGGGDFSQLLYSQFMSLNDLQKPEAASLKNDVVLFDSPPPPPLSPMSLKRPPPTSTTETLGNIEKHPRTTAEGGGSYIETEEERDRRQQLTQKMSSPKKTQQDEKKALKKKLKKVFK